MGDVERMEKSEGGHRSRFARRLILQHGIVGLQEGQDAHLVQGQCLLRGDLVAAVSEALQGSAAISLQVAPEGAVLVNDGGDVRDDAGFE